MDAEAIDDAKILAEARESKAFARQRILHRCGHPESLFSGTTASEFDSVTPDVAPVAAIPLAPVSTDEIRALGNPLADFLAEHSTPTIR